MNLRGFLIVFLLLAVPTLYGQATSATPQLLDSFGRSSGEERSARFDGFFIQLQNLPNAKGHVFVYCGKSCRYGEIESHFRGIELKLAGRGFDRSRITVVHGGYRETQSVELWMQPPGAGAPAANPTVNIKNVTFTKAIAKTIEPYDCCDDIVGQWKTFKPGK